MGFFMAPSKTFVNGVDLDTYLEQKERSRKPNKYLFKNNIEKHYFLNPVKLKYKPYMEPNGEVKILGNREKNLAVYEENMAEALEHKRYKNLLVIVLICHPDSGKDMSIREISNIAVKFGEEYGIVVNKNINYSLRIVVGAIRKSAFSDYFNVIDKTSTHPSYYYVDADILNSLSLTDALKLVNTKKQNDKPDEAPPIERKNDKPDEAPVKCENDKPDEAPPIERKNEKTMETVNLPTIKTEKPIATQKNDILALLNKVTQERGIYFTGNVNIYINYDLKDQ
jgi:hypothetical protein